MAGAWLSTSSFRSRVGAGALHGCRGYALLEDRVYLDREKSEERSVLNLFGRQRITLSGAETDTAEMTSVGGRFLPFERCGVDSTWMLSFPAAVKAIEDGQRRSRHRSALEKLEDVILDIRYTART